MAHDNIFSFGPILNGKMLNVNMTRLFSGDTVVDHVDGRHVVIIEWCGAILRVSNLRTARKYLACFAAVTAAINSASVLEVAVVD